MTSARPVLSRFCGSTSNIIGGGYPPSHRRIVQAADQQLFAGAARENFRDRRGDRPVGLVAIGLDLGRRQLRDLDERIDGFLRLSGHRWALVGMDMPEWLAERRRKPSLLAVCRKLSRLTHGRGVTIAQAEGGGPPWRRASSLTMLAQPIFWLSIGLQHRRMPGQRLKRENLNRQMGSGVRAPWSVVRDGGGIGDKKGRKARVGDQAVSWGAGAAEWLTLWGGRSHVNA